MKVLFVLITIDVIFYLILQLSQQLVSPISRRLANLSYVLWQVMTQPSDWSALSSWSCSCYFDSRWYFFSDKNNFIITFTKDGNIPRSDFVMFLLFLFWVSLIVFIILNDLSLHELSRISILILILPCTIPSGQSSEKSLHWAVCFLCYLILILFIYNISAGCIQHPDSLKFLVWWYCCICCKQHISLWWCSSGRMSSLLSRKDPGWTKHCTCTARK